MPEPIRSPKQYRSIAKARSNPYPRPQQQNYHPELAVVEPISQHSSLLGTIKNFVTAPLSWISPVDRRSYDNEYVQKRKDPLERSGTPPKPKRVRRDSPDAADQCPVIYSKPATPLWDVGNGVPPARLLEKERLLRGNDELYRGLSSPPMFRDRTSQSVEPLDSQLNTVHIRRSTTREHSLPPPSPFARSFSRVSMTPQPTGATFGPSPKRKQRDLTAPPLIPVAPLPPVPTFTRAPSVPPSSLFPKPPVRQMSEGPIMSLLSQSRQSLSPIRETSSMLLGSGDAIPASPSKAERALSTLETFRTPLPRLSSQVYPEDRRPRKVHVPLPSKQSPGDEPKKKKVLNIGPYPTETSGLRKLLQRKKQDNDSQATYGEAAVDVSTMDTNEHKPEAAQGKAANANEGLESISVTLETSTRNSKVDSYFSLRAPPIRLRRTHVSAPQVNKPRNKFSLKDDGDEPSMSVEELKAYESKIQKPNLMFNRRMSETGIQTDVSANAGKSSTPLLSSSSAPVRSFNDLLSEINPSTISKPIATFPIHVQKANMSSSTEPPVEVASSGNVSGGLPFSLLPSNSALPPLLTPSNDVIPPKPFASTTSASSNVPPMENTAGVSGIPSFFSPSKTEFTPPPLPINTLFTPPHITPLGRSIDQGPVKTLNDNDDGTSTPSLPKIQVGSGQSASSETTNIGNRSTHTMSSTEEASLNANPTPSPLFTPFGDTKKSAEVPFGIMDNFASPLAPANRPPPSTAPEIGSSKLLFGQATVKEPATSISFTKSDAPSRVSSFNFSAPPTAPSFSSSEFSSGKPAPEEPLKASMNIFSFGSSIKEVKQASLTLPTGGSSPSLVDPVITEPAPTEADNQMDTTDRMEESPARVPEKKDLVTTGSPFNFNNPGIPNSTFSFGNSTTKPATSPFLFGSAGNDAKNNHALTGTESFAFGQSKSTPVENGFHLGNSSSNLGGSGFGFSPKPSESPANPFGTNLVTSASAPSFSFTGSSNLAFGSSKPEIPVTGGSAPSSPSLFPQQSITSSPSFSFNLPPASMSFTKPEVTNSSSSSNQPFQFGASPSPGPGSPQPGAMFTLGAAATATPRKVKGLPQRRRK